MLNTQYLAGDGRPKPDALSLTVFVGPHGRGSNLMAINNAIQEGRLPARIVAVVGTRSDAPALARATETGLNTIVVPPQKDEAAYANALLAVLRDTGTDTIALAGYLRRLPSPVVAAYRHRILNVHPSLLPAFGGQGMYGRHVHQAVLDYGAKVSGCTVHLVDENYDTGPIVVQKAVPVEADDTPELLAARILPQEHAAFIEALQLLAEDRLRVNGRIVQIVPQR